MEWKKVRIFYVITILILFFLIILSYYFFSQYIIVFIVIFALALECFPWFLRGDPSKSPFETVVGGVVGESKYKKHKVSIWIIYIIILLVIAFLLFVVGFGYMT